MIEQTFVFIKPDAIERGIAGKIISRFENAGLKIVAMKQVWIDEKFAKEHYVELVEKNFYKYLEEYVVSGPVIALVLEGVHSTDFVRKIVGVTEPRTAMPGTIRGDFATSSYEYSDKKNISIKNLVHASDSPETAKKEVELWFSPEEIHSYERTDERHTR